MIFSTAYCRQKIILVIGIKSVEVDKNAYKKSLGVPEDSVLILSIGELIKRVNSDGAKEVIIATNPSVEGESTALLLEKLLHEQNPDLKLTRLARGLPLGVDLSYADQITLSAALENRTNL